jgi:hypothetical protein
MDNFNQILPPEILERLDSRNINIDLILDSKECEGRWPRCCVSINQQEIFNGSIIEQQEIQFSTVIIDDNVVNIKIEYYNKTSQDTKVDDHRNIVANQSLNISKFKLNGVDIIKNGMIYQAKFVMNLDLNKEKYFKEHNIPDRNHDYHFYENGTWTLQIEIPVLTFIINRTKQVETFEKIPYDNIIEDIIKKLEL